MIIRMIVTDLDGTLLRSDETVSDYSKAVLSRCRDMGIRIAFATARSFESSHIYRTALNPDGDIVTGGCLVYTGTLLLSSFYLPETQAATLLAELCAHQTIRSVSARSLNTAYSNISIEGRICADFKSPLPDRLLHCSCRTDDAAFMKTIAARYPDFSFLHIGGSDIYDINPKEASKFNGVKILSDHFDIPLSEIVAFGDDYSDVEMLRCCGVGVAMSNAIDECKNAADFVCESNDDDGMARWLEKNLL